MLAACRLIVLITSTLTLLSSPSVSAQPSRQLDYLTFNISPLLIPAAERCRIDPQEPDIPYALAACQQAASNGDAQAQFLLANLYYEGKVIPKDLALAINWFQRASLQGHAQAQYQIAFMLWYGEGVSRNPTEAYVMIKMSAVNGFDEAMNAAELFAEGLTEDQQSRAFYTLSRIFKNYHSNLNAEQPPLSNDPSLLPITTP